MILTVSSKIIGSKSNLVYDGCSWSWSQKIPENSILWGFDEPRDFSDAVACLNEEITGFCKTPWGKSFLLIGENIDNIPWRKCVPSWAWKDIVCNLVDQLWMILNDKSNSYYVSTFRRNREITCKTKN